MAYEFKLPELGEGLEEGEIASWLVKPGDEVKEDDSLVEIQNDKSVEELPSPVSGKVIDILVPEGETAKIGDVIVTIDDGSGDAAPAAKAETPAATKTEARQVKQLKLPLQHQHNRLEPRLRAILINGSWQCHQCASTHVIRTLTSR